MKSFILLLLSSILFNSCSNKYRALKSNYTFKSKNGNPDYSDLNYWAAHPWKKDPSDSVPKPLLYEKRDSITDVFFLHPTSYTRNIKMKTPNAPIDNSLINAKTDYTSILYQASVFNQQSRVFAPRYRQAHIKLFFSKDKKKADAAFAIAYKDIRESFEYYLKNWNHGRPIIIASHSQGSKMAEKQLVVAYLPGWPVPKDYFTSLKMCSDSTQTGCICSWRTLRKGFIPFYLKNENGNSFVTNPLTWTTGNEYASKQLNKGSVLSRFNKVYKHTTDAEISNGLLYVHKPKFPWSFLYFSRNYHIGDINLFYMNIRGNVAKRIDAFLNN